MSKKVVLVTGASGNVGKATLKELGKYADSLDVKAGTRDPAKQAELADLGPNVTVVAADGANLPTALGGVDYVFAIPPGTKDRAEIVEKIVVEAAAAKVKFVLVLSVATTPLPETIFGGQFAKLEAVVKSAGVPYALIRAPIFLDNNWGHLPTIKSQSAFYGADIPDAPKIAISTAEIAAVAGKILLDPAPHTGKTYTIGSPPFSANDLAQAFSDSLGRTINYVQVSMEDQKKAMLAYLQDWQCDGVNELSQLANDNSPVLNTPEPAKTVEAILGRPAATVQDWVKGVAPAFQ